MGTKLVIVESPAKARTIGKILGKDYNSHDEVKVIPILLGKSKSGGITEFPCPEENGFII